MLNHQLLKFDPQGRVILSLEDTLQFNGGTPIAADGGLSSAPGGEPDAHLGGIGYLNVGNLTDSNNPLLPPSGGVLTSNNGSVRVSTELPTHWYAGLPMTAEGKLSISPGVIPPPDTGEFDDSFSNSFDIGD
jgi:hypothetical protein